VRGRKQKPGRSEVIVAAARAKPRAFPLIGLDGWAGTLDEEEGLLETSSSLSTGVAEKHGHNFATEMRTILFPPPKHPWIGELSKSMRGLIR
jgi:hypothetical protein